MKTIRTLFVGLAALAVTLPAGAAPRVVATILPIHALVANVMEGVGQPHLLLPPSISEHTAALKPSDAKVLAEADVVVWVGDGIETVLAKPIRNSGPRTTVVTLSRDAGISLLRNREGGLWEEHVEDHAGKHGKASGKRIVRSHDHGSRPAHVEENQHIWLDPANARQIVRHVAEVLARTDPANAVRYRSNASAEENRLADLDRELASLLLPAQGVPFIVFHDAFPYFESRYGLNAVGSITVSPEQKSGPRRMTEIRNKLTATRSICVFGEPQYDPSLLRSLIEGTSARLETLDPIGIDLAPGPGAYASLMRNLGRAFRDCLAGGAS